MFFSLLAHILGVCCFLYALQLIYHLGQDFRGKTFPTVLLPLCGGIIAIVFTLAAVIGVDSVFPVGSTASPAAFFIRVSFLVPLAYLTVFLFSHLVAAVIGRRYSTDIVCRTAYLGITLLTFSPIGKLWLDMTRHFFSTGI